MAQRIGKSGEMFVASLMLREGLNVYLPMVDVGVDVFVEDLENPNGRSARVQIKTCDNDHENIKQSYPQFPFGGYKQKDNFWFAFYASKPGIVWLMSSAEIASEKEHINKKQGRIYMYDIVKPPKRHVRRGALDKYVVYPPELAGRSFRKMIWGK